MAESGLRGAGTRVIAPEPHEAVGDDVVEPRHQCLDPGYPTYFWGNYTPQNMQDITQKRKDIQGPLCVENERPSPKLRV